MRPHAETLVVATTNRGKLEELRALLADLPVEVKTAADMMSEPPRVEEDGATFAENATKKALAIATATMTLTLADDSGLEVDALAGRPGVKSARFAHDRATDAENNAALLGALETLDAPMAPGFVARFRCVLALVDPYTGGGKVHTVEGVCEGHVARTPRGTGGFGYDPLFVVKGGEQTMAELGVDEKARVSHRGQAFAALRGVLEAVLKERAEQSRRIG